MPAQQDMGQLLVVPIAGMTETESHPSSSAIAPEAARSRDDFLRLP